MERREHAPFRGGREVGLEPNLLGRSHCGGHEARIAVQHHDVPRAEVDAVVALGRIAGRGAEVVEVRDGRGARIVFVIADHRIRTGLVAAPGRVVTVLEVGGRAVGIGVVAQGEDGALRGVEHRRRGLVVGAVAPRDVAGQEQRGARGRLAHGHDRLPRTRCAVFVRHRHGRGVGARRGVGVGRADAGCLTGHTAGRGRRSVAPVYRVGPRRVVRAGVAERSAECNRAAGVGAEARRDAHRGRHVGDGRGGGRRRARRALRIGDGEGHAVGAVAGVGMARARAGAGSAVAEPPRVGQRIAVRIG